MAETAEGWLLGCLLLLLLADEQFGIFLEMFRQMRSQQACMPVNIAENGAVAERPFAQLLVALLHGFSEVGVLQQALPEGGRGLGVAALKAPGINLVGIAEVAVAVGQIVVPHRAGHQLASRAVGVQLLFVEVGAALVAVGIQAELGMDEVVDERGHVDVACIAALRVGKVVSLYGLFYGVDKGFDVL